MNANNGFVPGSFLLKIYNFFVRILGAEIDLLLAYLSIISSGVRPLNRSLHSPLKYLIIAHVPAFRIPYMNTFIGGPYVLFLRIIGMISLITRKLFSQHFQNNVNCASFKFPKCMEFFSLKSW